MFSHTAAQNELINDNLRPKEKSQVVMSGQLFHCFPLVPQNVLLFHISL